MLFLRVIVWCGAEKFSLKKSCFYLYIRRDTFGLWSASTTGQRSYVYDKGTTYASHCKTRVGGLEMRADLKKIGEQKRTDLVGQTERALYLLDVISTITDRGNNAEVRRKKDGTLTVYEVKKNIVTV